MMYDEVVPANLNIPGLQKFWRSASIFLNVILSLNLVFHQSQWDRDIPSLYYYMATEPGQPPNWSTINDERWMINDIWYMINDKWSTVQNGQ